MNSLERTELLGPIMVNMLQNKAVDFCEGIFNEEYTSPGHKPWQEVFRGMSEDQKKLVTEFVNYVMMGSINDFLYSKDVQQLLDVDESIVSRYHSEWRPQLAKITDVFPSS